MILYHLDRSGQLPATGAIELQPLTKLPPTIAGTSFFDVFPSGVSQHCLTYFTDKATIIPYGPTVPGFIALNASVFQRETTKVTHQIIEFVFELVRRLSFPHCPSRLTAFFAVDHPALLTTMWNFPITGGEKLYQVDAPNDAPRFDANHLKGGINLNLYDNGAVYGSLMPILFDLAYKYWSGEHSANPKLEYLIDLPAELPRTEIPLSLMDAESPRHSTEAYPE